MPIKCLYIAGEGTTNGVPLLWQKVENAAHDELKILRQQATPFEKQVEIVKDEKPDLLILDLRLDEKKGIAYRGPALARELRSRMTEQRLSPFPIVLCSFSNKLKQAYDLDETVHNLFDRIYVKDKEIGADAKQVALELQSLVKGYQWITKKRTTSKLKFYQMLGLGNQDASIMDPRVGQRFTMSIKKYPVHEYARYILKEMVEKPGPLINELVLAALLGVDIQQSKDWPKCKALISKISAYTGAFSEAWPRWWDFKLDMWWESQPNCPDTLIGLRAKARVDFLTTITGLDNLVSAQPIQEGYSTRYMTICLGLEKPLDPLNGIWANFDELKSWQQPLFLSLKAASEQIGWEKGLRIHPLMADRLDEIIYLRGG